VKVKERKAAKASNFPQIKRAQLEPFVEANAFEPSAAKVSDSDLNDFDKRTVIEEFLSRG